MANDDWSPASGFGIYAENGFVRLRIGPEKPVEGLTPPRFDLALPPDQAREIAAAILQAAEIAERTPKGH